MKISLIPTITGILLFTALIVIYSKNEIAFDGYKLIGFPFYFYKDTSAKLIDPNYRTQLGFNFKYFLLDLAALAVFIFFANILWNISRSINKR
ncbi:MAG: hypothetical protein JWR38_4065 [Mucilaginibacter sp.]|nr:hypothetical protein [Mucilaginibacter sp.]